MKRYKKISPTKKISKKLARHDLFLGHDSTIFEWHTGYPDLERLAHFFILMA